MGPWVIKKEIIIVTNNSGIVGYLWGNTYIYIYFYVHQNPNSLIWRQLQQNPCDHKLTNSRLGYHNYAYSVISKSWITSITSIEALHRTFQLPPHQDNKLSSIFLDTNRTINCRQWLFGTSTHHYNKKCL